MKSVNFCYWLKGFIDINNPEKINEAQVLKIKEHLGLVFKYDIDPSYGDKELQKKLSAAHSGFEENPFNDFKEEETIEEDPFSGWNDDIGGTLFKC